MSHGHKSYANSLVQKTRSIWNPPALKPTTSHGLTWRAMASASIAEKVTRFPYFRACPANQTIASYNWELMEKSIW